MAMDLTTGQGSKTALSRAQDSVVDGIHPGEGEQETLNILDFCEQELKIELYPRQQLILKVFYDLPLTLEEQEDWDNLLGGGNPYARAWATGGPYNFLILIVGRRGSKTLLGAVIQAYELYTLLRMSNPHGRFKILPRQRISFINAAAAQEQADIFFNVFKGLSGESEFLSQRQRRSIDTRVDYSKHLRAEKLHSNSRSQRGRTAWMVTFDELAHFIDTAGPNSDDQVWKALQPSTKTFLQYGKTLILTSPGAAEGVTYGKYQLIAEGKIAHALCVQLATWELNPYITLNDLEEERIADPEFFEMEYGGQFGEKEGKFLNFLAVERCFDTTRRIASLDEVEEARRGYSSEEREELRNRVYYAHCDPGLRSNRLAFVLVHSDYESGHCWLDYAFTMEPQGGEDIDLDEARKHIKEVFRLFKFRRVFFDQWNSALMIRQLKNDGVPAEEFTFTEKSNMDIYANLKRLINRGELFSPSFSLCHAELNALVRKITRHGFTVQAADRGPVRTDDVADALAAASFKATERTGERRRTFLKV